jgi:long-chain acyl-CoA synthetase
MRVRRDGRWTGLSYRQLAEQVQAASVGLRELGLRDGERVAILSENRPEWAVADYACLAARCTDVPIYPTLPARQAEYVLRDSGAAALLVSSGAQLEKALAVRDRLPALRHLVAFDPKARAPGVLGFEDLLA